MNNSATAQKENVQGTLNLQTVAMPSNTNANGDIFAGWLVSQMDLAASIEAINICRGRVATVAVDHMRFLHAVHVGAAMMIDDALGITRGA